MHFTKAIIAPLLAITPLTSAAVIEMFSGGGCSGTKVGERNVYDSSCAYVNPGFSSYRLKAQAYRAFQELTVYSPQACGGAIVSKKCVIGVNSLHVGDCVTLSGTGNALSSYSNAADCPN
jgi:hypothetical protein